MKDKILNLLKENNRTYTAFELKDALGLNTTEEIREMLDCLNELESDLTIYHTNKDKYIAFEYSHLKKGKIDVSEKGFGFVLMDDEDDIHVDKDHLNGAQDGDMVIVEIIGSAHGEKKEGRVLRIAKRSYGPIVGEYSSNNGNPTVIVSDKKFKQKIVLTKESCKNAVDGHIVLLNVIKELDHNTILAEIKTIIGHKNDVGVDVEAIIYKHAFSPKFPDEVLEELDSIPDSVREEDKKGRRDLTDQFIPSSSPSLGFLVVQEIDTQKLSLYSFNLSQTESLPQPEGPDKTTKLPF